MAQWNSRVSARISQRLAEERKLLIHNSSTGKLEGLRFSLRLTCQGQGPGLRSGRIHAAWLSRVPRPGSSSHGRRGPQVEEDRGEVVMRGGDMAEEGVEHEPRAECK